MTPVARSPDQNPTEPTNRDSDRSVTTSVARFSDQNPAGALDGRFSGWRGGDVADDVLGWGLARLRELPWRETRDPWRVWTAEVMLQQTQVDRVVPKWEELLERYRSPSTLASASLGELLRLWQGLGYPRRARNLHAAAAVVADVHRDVVPDEVDALVALPGVGPYTARAILVFAYEQDVGVVDTNIARILARCHGERLTARQAQSLADDAVPPGEGWAWNQVLMDLGATVCRPVPRCAECPLARACAWCLAGHPDPDPAVRSAGVSTRQAPYDGSDRQARGRVLRRLTVRDASRDELLGLVRAHILDGLVADGLVVEHADGVLRLP